MRDFIDKNEGKLTIIRFVGFCLMLLGVLALILCAFFSGDKIPNLVATAFFITMLGFSLAFPSLLEGHEGLSTMRIVVFMVTNVVCMLLIKLGWSDDITSLEDIKLDQYWVGILAFVFGAKATQSFFESRMAIPKESEKLGASSLEYSSAEIAKLAVLQNEQYLKVKFPNIISVSDTVGDPGSAQHVVALYLKDHDTAGIPSSLEAKLPNNVNKVVPTEIIKGSGTAKIQYSQLDSEVSTLGKPNFFGSVCCGVKSTTDHNFKGIVTSGHIYTAGLYDDRSNGLLNQGQRTDILMSGIAAGRWTHKMLNQNQDLAVAELDPQIQESLNYQKFANGYYQVEDKDVKTVTANVTILSRKNKTVNAFILDYNVGLDVDYGISGLVYKTNIILIGSSNNRQTARPVSVGGDSGSCVYHTASGKLIGILVGRSENFTLVHPIQQTLSLLNLITF